MDLLYMGKKAEKIKYGIVLSIMREIFKCKLEIG